MKAVLKNVQAVFAAVDAGDFCDVGHYYCARIEKSTIIFPSGAKVFTDGTFVGPRRLHETLAGIPADY